MKKTISLIVILVLIAVMALGVVFAVPVDSPACVHSQGHFHASATGEVHASINSVLNACGGPGG